MFHRRGNYRGHWAWIAEALGSPRGDAALLERTPNLTDNGSHQLSNDPRQKAHEPQVRFWHLADVASGRRNVRYWGKSDVEARRPTASPHFMPPQLR